MNRRIVAMLILGLVLLGLSPRWSSAQGADGTPGQAAEGASIGEELPAPWLATDTDLDTDNDQDEIDRPDAAERAHGPASAEAGSGILQQAEPIDPGYVPNQLIVRFRPNVSNDVKRSLHNRFGAQVIDEIPEHDVQLLRLYDDAVAMVSAYQDRSEVMFAEPNYIAEVFGQPAPGAPIIGTDAGPADGGSADRAAPVDAAAASGPIAPDALMAAPSDPLYGQQWHHDKIDSERAWDYTKGDNVVVAIVDTGVDCQHVDLQGKCVAGYDFVNSDPNPDDDHGHGTHVAGIAAAATSNNLGVAGTGWNARIMPIKSLNRSGRGNHFDIAEGIDWAVDNGADVINMSLGAYFTSSTLQQAVVGAIADGVPVFAAAGNDAVSNPTYPASYAGVIGVAATTQSDGRASFSNYGSFVDIAAPGVGILSTVVTGGYQAWNGTSMAAPVAAGVGALLVAQDPSRSPTQIQLILETTAKDLGSPGKDSLYGAGRIDAGAALASQGGQPTPTPIGPTPTFAPPSPTVTPSGDYVQQLEDLINLERTRAGLQPLFVDTRLRSASARHVNDMGDNQFCSHNGSDGSTAGQRMLEAGYANPYGEIIACGQLTPADAVNAWMNSSPHVAIIMCATCTELGGGHRAENNGYQNYWTVTFGSEPVSGPTPTPAAQPSATVAPTQPNVPTATPSPTTPPVPPGGQEVTIPAANNRIGWVVSAQPDRNYFTDDDTFTGSYGGRTYHGAMQFDLDAVPVGAYVNYARLELTGRSNSFLGTSGTWSAKLLDVGIDAGFAGHGYTEIHGATVEATLLPLLGVTEVGEGIQNVFTFSASQVAALQSRVDSGRRISFRTDGPNGDPGMNLFTWDTGYGPNPRYPGAKLVLHYTMQPPTEAPTATPTGTAGPTEIPPTPTDGPPPTETPTPVPPTPTETPPPPPVRTPTATTVPTIEPGPDNGGLIEIAPACGDIGWVKQGEYGAHLCDPDTYTGYYQGFIYHGMMQFDLSAIPEGSRIVSARLAVTGRNGSFLSRFGNGRWQVAMLDPSVDPGWRGHSFNSISSASTQSLLRPVMLQSDMDVGRRNTFVFSQDQLFYLEQRLSSTQKVSFRIDGPRAGISNVFSWDTGYAGGEPPILSIVFGPPNSDGPVPTPDPTAEARLAEMLHRINVEREKAGVRPVMSDDNLMDAAQTHNMDMAWNNFFSHVGSDGSTPFERVEETDYAPAGVGEVLAAATSNVDVIVDAWLSVDDQRAVLLDPRWHHVGLHYVLRNATAYRHYWTVKLAEPASP